MGALSDLQVVITGGGTGGHVYPALEVARTLAERGAGIRYLGANRGQEGPICRERGIEFQGFASRALYSLRTPRGWGSLYLLLKATGSAKKALRERRPDAVFSTGGFSAAPIVAAARSLGIPYAIHETNSVPGRSNRMFASKAAAVTCTFKSTVDILPGAIRTGQPIRRELREAAKEPRTERAGDLVVVIGGSQGSEFLNTVVPRVPSFLRERCEILLATGRGNFDRVFSENREVSGLRLAPYLETAEIVDAYRNASIAVARSGGTVAEFALFGLPSVLVPLPTSADNHQLRNAREFVELGGAILVEQKDASPEALAEAIDHWLGSRDLRTRAAASLMQWDVPDATDRIADVVIGAGNRHN